jgi:predicted RNA-binding Zn ribbon-like protein
MPVTPSHVTLLGGALCLNFTNTKNWRADDKAYDHFWGYSSFLSWTLQLGLLSPSAAERLAELAEQQETAARAALDKAARVREAVYAVFASSAGGADMPAQALDTINMTWREAMKHRRLVREGQKLVWKWDEADGWLDSALWPVIESAAELLVSEKCDRVKCCGGCGWLFLDTTRDGRRRWCDMKLCGNRAKARRYYERNRG